MDIGRMITQMGQTEQAIQALTEGLADVQVRWRPDPEAWSILEVINHLYDEEREDFRTRLDYLLHRPGETAPPIDPQGWVTARKYNTRELKASLAAFSLERKRSIAWLKSLSSPDFDSFIEAPFGRITAGDMLAAWVSHDLLHLRQLVELRYAYGRTLTAPYVPDYAGEW